MVVIASPTKINNLLTLCALVKVLSLFFVMEARGKWVSNPFGIDVVTQNFY